MKVVTRNGKYIGEIVEYTGSGGIKTNIRIGSFASVAFPSIMIFCSEGSVKSIIAGIILLAISVAIGIAVKGAKEYFMDILGVCFLVAGVPLSISFGKFVTEHSHWTVGWLVGNIAFFILMSIIDKIFFDN